MLAELAKTKDVQAVFTERLPDIPYQCLHLFDASAPFHRWGVEAHVVPTIFENLAIVSHANFAPELRHWNRHALKQRLYWASAREDEMRAKFDQNGCVCTGSVFVLAVLFALTAIAAILVLKSRNES